MPFPPALPGLPVSADERLLLLGALGYLVLGLAYLTCTGLSSTWFRIQRPEIGTGPGASVAAAVVWATVVVLWPVPLACRTSRILHRRLRSVPEEALVWRSAPAGPDVAASAPGADKSAAALWRAPPRWYRQEYDAVRAALAEGMPLIAQARAADLVSTSAVVLGADHLSTLDAWDLLSHTVRSAATQRPRPSSPVPDSADSVYRRAATASR
ncbi:hypothetical protein AB0K43_30055 [Kitasatospora sp. NPDC049258]|uniref:hypothetical protein n=1 Tax=Kitasatospora sp. NPDC049258 TaxID=3155394 RepID=UPI00342167D2